MKLKFNNDLVVCIICLILLGLTIFLSYQYIKDVQELNNTIEVLEEKNKYLLLDEDDLRVCPLCGTTPEIKQLNYTKYFIRCPHCGLETGAYRTIDEVTESWNTLGGLDN